MMCERALSRKTQGSLLADKQFVQGYIADSYAQLAAVPPVRAVHGVGDRQAQGLPQGAQGHRRGQGAHAAACCTTSCSGRIQVHGALGVSNEMPLGRHDAGRPVMGLADGPTEVHKVTVARQVLRDYQAERRPVADRAPAREAGRAPRPSSPTYLEHEVGNL